MTKATILVVDDEPSVRFALAERLSEEEYCVLEAGSGQEALKQFDQGVDLALLDYRLPDTNGLSLLKRIRQQDPETVVILLTAVRDVASAVEAMKAGAFHYATKPFNLDEIVVLVDRALETTALHRELRTFRASQRDSYGFGRLVGTSPALVEVKRLLAKVAASPASTVLLTGETGTGKDLAAKAIHYASARANRPFMNITCSALPDTLLETELFGHERGAFTDARIQKRGLLESAHGGTVFLDEVGEMSPASQAKLLRFLEEKTFKRLGGSQDIHVDVRVIAATHQDLAQTAKTGAFREDLFYRLSVLPIYLPALRERDADIPLLLKYFADQFSVELKKTVHGIDDEVFAALGRYPWPGNVRELKNAVERAMLLFEGGRLALADFAMPLSGVTDPDDLDLPRRGVDLEQLERRFVRQALERTRWNRTKAATLLGLSREQIRYRIERFGLVRPEAD